MVIFYTAFNQVILNFRIRFFNPLSAFSSLQKATLLCHAVLLAGVWFALILAQVNNVAA